MSDPEWHSFKVTVDGMIMAEVDGSDRGQVLHEAMHYPMIYAQESRDVKIEGVTPEDFEKYLKPNGMVTVQ